MVLPPKSSCCQGNALLLLACSSMLSLCIGASATKQEPQSHYSNAKPKPKPNIIVVLTDDQDLRLGSLRAMPFLRESILPQSANLSNFFVHTPICCPSRATLLSGRYVHNIKASSAKAGGCMHMNTSRDTNPTYWQQSLIRNLHDDHGYVTGAFGKVLNAMATYGCDGIKTHPHGLDRSFIMCNPAFYNEKWANFTTLKDGSVTGSVVQTGNKAEDYTTTLLGNASLAWIKEIVSQGPDHPPFFAWVGPHAPHLPSTPPPYSVDPAVQKLPLLEDPMYGVLATDKHAFFPREPVINRADRKAIDVEHSDRLLSLVAVDDVLRQLVQYLKSVGEWDNTFLFYTSDHGYSLGQFRVDSHKTQVYDHNTRVPMIIAGPGVSKGSDLPLVTSMVDLAPTMLELAAGGDNASPVPDYMDGMSFAPMLLSHGKMISTWKDAALVEYLSIRPKNTLCSDTPSSEDVAEYLDAYGYHADTETDEAGRPLLCSNSPDKKQKHIHDGPKNTFVALRIIDGVQDLLYAEFADVNNPLAWDFAPDQLNFFELYNVSEDYYMMHNIYKSAPKSLKQQLHERLQTAIHCKGNQQCSKILKGQAFAGMQAYV